MVDDDEALALGLAETGARDDRGMDLRRAMDRVTVARRVAREGPSSATARQLSEGKMTARQRVDHLFDTGSFTEIGTFRRRRSGQGSLNGERPFTDGVITGWGRINGRVVFCYSQDSRIFGGSLGEEHGAKIHKLIDMATRAKRPLIALNDGGGARIQEGVAALAGYGGIFARHVTASGIIPQISVILGPCAGGAAYAPALTDFVFMVTGSARMFVTGPSVLEEVTGEVVTQEDLGGAGVHATRSGVAHAIYPSEVDCLDDVRYLLSLLPDNCEQPVPQFDSSLSPDAEVPELLHIVPADPRKSYDVRRVIRALMDDGEFFELQQDWAPTMVCSLGRMNGSTVGILANQPAVSAGVLDVDSSCKASRFVQMCDAFNIPLITLVDVPGFMPGVTQEHGGIIRHGAKLVYAYCTSTVPRISLILRKAYGGAYIVMDSRSIGCDLSFAWPTNEVAVMGAEGAARIIFGREIAAASNQSLQRELRIREYRNEFMNPFVAVERGVVDEIISPEMTRAVLIDALDMLAWKSTDFTGRSRGNPPQ